MRISLRDMGFALFFLTIITLVAVEASDAETPSPQAAQFSASSNPDDSNKSENRF